MTPTDKWQIAVKCMTILTFLILCGLISLDPWAPLYSGKAFNRAGNRFEVPKTNPIAVRLSPTVRYQLQNDSISVAEFSALLPRGGHTVWVDDERGAPQVYTVTLFHQLKCLDLIRDYYAADKPPRQSLPPTILHCLNYLKQTILCRPSVALESIQTPDGHAVRSYEAVCNDWSAVYAEAERNFDRYMGMHKA